MNENEVIINSIINNHYPYINLIDRKIILQSIKYIDNLNTCLKYVTFTDIYSDNIEYFSKKIFSYDDHVIDILRYKRFLNYSLFRCTDNKLYFSDEFINYVKIYSTI